MTAASESRRLGTAVTTGLGVVLIAWALTVDFAKVTTGFFSDGATYYSLAHSLAADFDFEYRREDLVRIWREFPSGPEGIFLKSGRDLKGLDVGRTFPFVSIESADDPDPSRLYYGKAFLYPLAAAPFVWLFGTNGFLVLHALLMTAAFGCAYAFLAARGSPIAALVFASAFLLVSVAPVYMVWLTPDFFNAALVLGGFFFWCYREVAPVRSAWLAGARADTAAAVLLGLATFSKPTHVLLIAPMIALPLLRRQWARAATSAAVFALVVGGLFGANVAITGEWNYQGGDRRTFYSGQGGFPFQTEQHAFDVVGLDRATNRVPVEVLASKDAVIDVFRHNLLYFFFGRHTGFALYYFPGFFAMLLFLASRDRPGWQWLALAAGLGSAVALVLYMPFTYSGGGGPVGNRYFLGVYPVFLFVMPPLARVWPGVVAAGVSAVFTAQLVSNPFFVSFRPAEHTKRGPYRWFPAELTLVNDLPVNVNPSRSRQPLGGTPPLSAYFLDDNAYNREGDAFWVRGESRADVMLRAPIVSEVRDGQEVLRPMRVSWLDVHLETGPRANRVTVRTGAGRWLVDLPANDRRSVTVEMPAGLPYRPHPDYPTNYVYAIAIESESGFLPLFETGSRDNRFLGVFVRLVPRYE